MSPLELDQLVREIGDEVHRRLGSGLEHACACGTTPSRPIVNGHAASGITWQAGVGAASISPESAIAGLINQALLRPEATSEQIANSCREARQYGFASVCVTPSRVALAVRELRGTPIRVGAVIGYPHGTTLTSVKLAEAEQVLKLGARELEVTLHPGALNSGDLDSVYTEIRLLAECAHSAGAAVKVLAEMALLGEQQKVMACALAKLGGADMVKTSTDAGGIAVAADVILAHRIVGGELGIEAAGAVDSYARLREIVAAGATRVGTTAGAAIVNEASRA